TLLVALALICGCASNQGGGSDETFSTSSGPFYGRALDQREMKEGAPTMRPGMNPADVRDPTELTRPQSTRPSP
ncbi:MAG TPA: hypothetical protein VHH88_06985, partial [Verrucomicrobiae bacterium]|nr:hypothetical protein [Verrucomicrobiae bacterium]